jgi:hypothetical protein
MKNLVLGLFGLALLLTPVMAEPMKAQIKVPGMT